MESEKLVAFTGTWRTPTKEEDEKRLIRAAKWYQGKKWYEPKKYLLKEMMECAYRLNNIHN